MKTAKRIFAALSAVVMTVSMFAEPLCAAVTTAPDPDNFAGGGYTESVTSEAAETPEVTSSASEPETTEPNATEPDLTEPSVQPETDDAETAAPSDDFAPESSETVGDSYVADAVITYCGMPEHIHSEACYNRLGELICEVEEHVHTELCYAPENYGIMTASIVHEELSEEGYDFVIAINASGGYTLTFTGTKIPDNSTLRKLLTIDGTNYFPLINMVVINDSVTEIGASAFINMHGLVAVDFQGINSHITELPTNCFANCQSLNTVDLESLIALDNIGLNAFNNSGIKSITIPSTVRTIDPNAFISTNSLETVYFEENYVMTNPPSFSNMKALKNINLENLKADTVYIPDNMFKSCTSLEALYIPSNFSQREKPNGSYENVNSLCSGCTSLKELIFAPNPRINALAFCTESTQIETLDLTPLTNLEYFREFNNTNLKSITFASDLDTSGGVCIDGCSSLETITFQKDVLADTTAYEAFDGCTSLLAVDLNKFVNLKTINTGTFNKCSSISELSIPSTVTKINPTAFANMTSLRSFTLNANIEKCSTDIFNGTPGFVLTIGEDVSVLNRDFLIAANGHTSDIVFPANAVFTLPAGDPVGGIFGDGTGEQTYLTDGDGNLYLLEDGGLSLVYAKNSLESVNIPASVGDVSVNYG